MKNTFRKFWGVFALLTVASMVIASCATPTPQVIRETIEVIQTVEVEKEVIQTVEVEVEVEVTPEPGPQTGPILHPEVSGEIELWHWWASPARRSALHRVIGICEQKLPNIKVTDVVKPWGDIWTANIAAVAAGSGMPDVIVSDRPTLPRDAEEGIYMSLQEWADRDNVTRDQYYDWAWDQTLYEGETYGIPQETDVRVLFYNKQHFIEAGLDPEDPPETWDELWEYADKLDIVEEDGTLVRVAFNPLWNAGPDFWFYNNDAYHIDDEGNFQLTSANAVETVEWIKSWIDRYGGYQALLDFQGKFSSPPNDLFMGNGVSMFTDIFGYNSQLIWYGPRGDTNRDMILDGEPRMEWGIALLPHDEDAEPGNWSGGFSFSIPTGAANPEAAWEFIKCAQSAEGQASWARDTQAQPTNIEAASDPGLQGLPQWRVVDDALATSFGGWFIPEYPNWSEQLNQRWESVWRGDVAPADMLAEAQAAIEAQIGK